MTRYLIVSPRGFCNETVIRYGSAEAINIASSIINDNVNAWAETVPEADKRVRAAKRKLAAAQRWMSRDEAENEAGLARLHEADVIDHRPIFLPSEGPRYRGGQKLPVGYDEPIYDR